jgi:serine/threonine protein kinase
VPHTHIAVAPPPHDNDDDNDDHDNSWYRAPELLCDNSHYDAKIDVWSTALVYAELLLGKTLLPGRDYMDQLRRTVKLVGQPSEEDMAFLVHPAAKKVGFLQADV